MFFTAVLSGDEDDKPFVSAVIGALMLTKGLQFPDQHSFELPTVLFVCCLENHSTRVSGWTFIFYFVGEFWGEDETFRERRYSRVDACENTTIL